MNGISRRQLLRLGVMSSAGLMLGVRLADGAFGASAFAVAEETSVLHPLVHIAPDGGIFLFAQNPEMGQGVKTSLPMILAEELGVHLQDVVVMQADWLPGQDLQFSGGSLSIRLNYQAMREAGAAARQMLLQAAAREWDTAAAGLTTDRGVVIDPASDRRLGYGELADAASRETPPDNVQLKDPANYRLIGHNPPSLDTPLKVTGRAQFGIDVQLPDMLYAAVVHSPIAGTNVAAVAPEPITTTFLPS